MYVYNKLHQIRKVIVRTLQKVLVMVWEPVGILLDSLYRRRKRKLDSLMTEDVALKVVSNWMAKGIIREGRTVAIIIAESVYSDNYTSYTLTNYTELNFVWKKSLKVGKAISFLDFRDKRIQEKIVKEIGSLKGFKIEEEVWDISTWESVRGYEKTYKISYKQK